MNEPVIVTVGFAAEPGGRGLAYAGIRIPGSHEESIVRVRFSCRARPALHGRDVAYAALNAVAQTLLDRNIRALELRTADERIADDLAKRADLPAALTMPYVALRCSLNRFREATVGRDAAGASRDLAARARAEVCLGAAA
jgi:sugar phosphate isomerase/epimerase